MKQGKLNMTLVYIFMLLLIVCIALAFTLVLLREEVKEKSLSYDKTVINKVQVITKLRNHTIYQPILRINNTHEIKTEIVQRVTQDEVDYMNHILNK